MGARLNTALSRVMSQFVNSKRYVELLRTIVERIEDTDALLADLATKRWLDTAEGVWLDMIGVIIGIPRFFEEHQGPFFTYKSAYPGVDDPTLAYSQLPAPATGGRYQSVFGIDTDQFISDADYRKWLKAKAKSTKSAGTLADVYTFVKEALDVETTVTLGGTRLIKIVPDTPLSSWKQARIRQWAPVNSGIDLQIVN
jgi:hypothetical protein